MTIALSARSASTTARQVRSAASAETCSDEALLARIADRDRLAMQTLFARHRTRLYRWLLRLVGNEAVAEDLLSDVFLDVWRQAAHFEARSSVATWLMSIARYKALSARRRRTDEPLTDGITEAITDPSDNPEAAFEKKSRGEVLRQAISNLSPEHSEVIDLVYYHGKTADEVARILHVPQATVKTRMFYARKRLATLVAW
jgi:RNA polymerase sigma-70 factor (ECF subfamily)